MARALLLLATVFSQILLALVAPSWSPSPPTATAASRLSMPANPSAGTAPVALDIYVTGPYKEAFNRETNVDIANRVIGFGFTDIREDHLWTIRVCRAPVRAGRLGANLINRQNLRMDQRSSP